jgi:hypothetical protein
VAGRSRVNAFEMPMPRMEVNVMLIKPFTLFHLHTCASPTLSRALWLAGAGLLTWAYGNRIAATLLLLVAGVAWLIAGSWRALHIRAAAAVLTFLAQGEISVRTLRLHASADHIIMFSADVYTALLAQVPPFAKDAISVVCESLRNQAVLLSH